MRQIDMGTNPQPFALSSSGGPGPGSGPPRLLDGHKLIKLKGIRSRLNASDLAW